MNPPLKITCRSGPIFDNRLEFHLHGRTEEGRVIITKPLEMVSVPADDPSLAFERVPTFSLEPSTCQSLMDSLWHHGVRPTEGHGSTGQLAATEKHLNHLTTLLDKTLTTVLKVADASIQTNAPAA